MNKLATLFALLTIISLMGCVSNPNARRYSPREIKPLPTNADFEKKILSALKINPNHAFESLIQIAENTSSHSPLKLCEFDHFPYACPLPEIGGERWRLVSDEVESYVEERKKSSLKIITEAAESGDIKMQFFLAKFYQFGYVADINLDLATSWYLRAAKAGNKDAAKLLGSMQWLGIGAPKNLQKAGNWYAEAIKLGAIPPNKTNDKKSQLKTDWALTIDTIATHYLIKNKYFKLMQEGWVDILVSADGKLNIGKNSGNQRLNAQAIEYLKTVIAMAPPPEEIKSVDLVLVVPIAFKFSD